MYRRLRIMACSLLLCAMPAHAVEYFGLDLGVSDKASTLDVLKKAGATVDTSFGYKGYVELPYYRITAYDRMSKYGVIKDARVEFAPDGLLSRILVSYEDSYPSSLYNLFKDGMDTKYGKAPGSSRDLSFHKKHIYRADNTEIKLAHDRMDDDTTISYEWLPARPAIEKMQNAIEQDIRQKHARKVQQDI